MAKQMNSKLPSVEKAKPIDMNEYKPGEVYVSEPGSTITGASAARNGSSVPGVESVVIELPIGPRSNGYLNERVNMHLTTQVQRVAMQRLRNGLIETRAVLKDGTKVANEQHAIRWLLESLPLS